MMVRRDIEELSDSELLDLYKLINEFVLYLEKELGGIEDAK